MGCLKHALRSVGASSPSEDVLESYIGPPLHQTLSQLLGTTHSSHLNNAVDFYRERFAAKGMFENRVYPGIVEALKELQRLGVRLFVATSKPQPFTEQILDHFRLRSLFHGVYGSALDGRLSNKGELISHIMREEGLAPLETAMVGDRAQDIDGARANDVFAIGVLWGYGSREELLSAGAEALCEQPRGLAETVSFNYPFNPARAEKPARAG